VPVGLDLAEDLAGDAGRIAHFVEGDPFASLVASGALIEIDGGLLPDVERLPVQNRLGAGLFDPHLHVFAATAVDLRKGGALPQLGIESHRGQDFEPPGARPLGTSGSICPG